MLLFGGKDLGERAISTLVLVPVVLVATYMGGWLFSLVWALAGCAILYEWGAIARLERRPAWLAVGIASLGGAALLLEMGSSQYAFSLLMLGAAAAAFVVPQQSGFALAGILVAGIACLPVMTLRRSDDWGLTAVLFLYAVVWATDVFAYFAGRLVGGPKLWPKVSPNKTWSGAIGGALAGLIAGGCVSVFAGLPAALPVVGLAIFMSLAGQGGDLAESAAKRFFGVKDTGRLIPGHGGFLDRLDGFAAASLVAVLVALVRNGTDPAAGLLLW